MAPFFIVCKQMIFLPYFSDRRFGDFLSTSIRYPQYFFTLSDEKVVLGFSLGDKIVAHMRWHYSVLTNDIVPYQLGNDATK